MTAVVGIDTRQDVEKSPADQLKRSLSSLQILVSVIGP